jgi:hypothetical protein
MEFLGVFRNLVIRLPAAFGNSFTTRAGVEKWFLYNISGTVK